MPPIRRVLGHVSTETARATRKCHRKPKEHSIARGEACLVVKDQGQGSKKNYCRVCARSILEHAQADLDLLTTVLYGAE